MLIQEGDAAGVDAQALPDPIAEDESGIEYRNDGFGARFQLAVDVNPDISVARIVDELVGTLGHRSHAHGTVSVMVTICCALRNVRVASIALSVGKCRGASALWFAEGASKVPAKIVSLAITVKVTCDVE